MNFSKSAAMATFRYCCFIAVAISFVITLDGASARKTAEDKVNAILSSVPKYQKDEFVRYHLHHGYELSKKRENGRYPAFYTKLGDDDTISFYDYYATNNLITDQERIKDVQNVICWGHLCIDISDPGVHP